MNAKKAKKIGYKPKNILKARLSFNDGYAERPLYSIKANTNEKEKGINMVELIKDNFNITQSDIKEFQKIQFNELSSDFEELEKKMVDRKPIKWERDERGNIISPFGNKARGLGLIKDK